MTDPPRITVERRHDGVLVVVLAGRWRLRERPPSVEPVVRALADRPPRVAFDATAVTAWDGSLLAAVVRIDEACAAEQIPVERDGLPAGVGRLFGLADRAPVRIEAPPPPRPPLVERIGLAATARMQSFVDGVSFVGDVVIAFARMVVGRSHVRGRDVLLQLEVAGVQALGIVTLVCFLVGVILAFVGATELEAFGAGIYIADLVGVAMVREMGALMAAIVLAGRTGAAFAAEIGTMRVTQELDALHTLDIPAAELLVLPRVLALTLMLPLLTLYADIVGIVGGAAIGIGMLGISPEVYYTHTVEAVTLVHMLGGIGKAAVYGALVAGAGCLAGLRSGASAAAVGRAATSAVVSGMVLVITACGLFALLFYVLGI